MDGSRKRKPEDLLPLKPVDLLVLMTLARGERHGYGIVTDIAERSDGTVRLVPGNLYAVLRRLRRAGLVEESDRRPAPEVDDERRRYYRITAFGRQVVTAEASRLRTLVAAAESLDLLGDPEPSGP